LRARSRRARRRPVRVHRRVVQQAGRSRVVRRRSPIVPAESDSS
jgi:hypothetical protein